MAVEVFHPMVNVVEVVLFAERSGEERRNVIHYNYSGTRPSSGEMLNLLNDVETDIIQYYEDFVALGTRWYQLTARDMTDENGAIASKSINRISAGPVDNLPGAMSLCLTKRTARPGRSFRGRFYLIDLPEDIFNGDDLNVTFIPAINTLITHLLLVRQAGRFTPAVGSRKLQGGTAIQAITYDLVADTQTRRGKGRGR